MDDPPVEEQPPPVPAWTRPGYRPPLRLPITLICIAVVSLYVIQLVVLLIATPSLFHMWEPARAVARMVDVTMDSFTALDEATPFEQGLDRLLSGSPASVREELDKAYSRTLDDFQLDPNLRDEPWASSLPADAETAMMTRGRALLQKLRWINILHFPVIIAGLAVLAARWRWILRPAEAAFGLTVAPWSFGFGAGVILRILAWGIAVEWCMLKMPVDLMCIHALLTAVPMLLIAHRYLFLPDGSSLLRGFGLNPGGGAMAKGGPFCPRVVCGRPVGKPGYSVCRGECRRRPGQRLCFRGDPHLFPPRVPRGLLERRDPCGGLRKVPQSLPLHFCPLLQQLRLLWCDLVAVPIRRFQPLDGFSNAWKAPGYLSTIVAVPVPAS